MAKFKVKAGSHVGKNGKIYRLGDVVESSSDLCKIFKEKFERVTILPPAGAAASSPTPASVEETEEADETPMAKATTKAATNPAKKKA